MFRYLPPLNPLRAFEAAARHGSFTRAAQELCVTQGAVSRQVKKLEEFLGTELFLRGPSRLASTSTAQTLAATVTPAFESIDQCMEAVMSRRSVLRLQVAPTFAIRRLMPRLGRFTERNGKIDVRVTITLHPEAFDSRSFDAGIVYGDGAWPGLSVTRLSSESLVPVCAPALMAGPHPIREAADLRHHRLLHTSTDRRDWPLWLNAVGAEGVPPYEGPAFETLDMAVRAAEAGHGVAIGDLSLIAEDVAARKLHVPIDRPVLSGRGIFFVCPEATANQDAISTFRTWILSEAPALPRDQGTF